MNIRIGFLGVMLIAFFVLGTHHSFAQSKKEVTLQGQIVDVTGFYTSNMQWDAESMMKAAKEGHALGFYDTKAKLLYVVTLKDKKKAVNDVLLPHVGLRVYVKGRTSMKDNVNYILLSKIGKLTE